MSDNDGESDGDVNEGQQQQQPPSPPPPPQPQQHLTLVEVDTMCRNALSTSGLNAVATEVITTVVTAAEQDGGHSHGLFHVPGYC